VMKTELRFLATVPEGGQSCSLSSGEDGMRDPSPQRTGIIELGYRPIRKFFEHPMSNYAAALAYRGLFGLFPFVLLLVVLAGALGLADYLQEAIDHASAESAQHVPQQLEPVIERGREQLQPLQSMVEQAQKQAKGELLFFGVALALWSVSAVARTLTEAFNVAYDVPETRPWWKMLLLTLAFGPILALMVIVSVGLMLIGPHLVERIAELVGLDELFVLLWGWLRFPVAFFLLAIVLSVVYRYGPDHRQRFRSVVPGVALTVVLWVITSVGFSFYLANFANYGIAYGSLGTAVGLLLYFNLTASVVLLGAEVNATIYHAAPNRMMQAGNQGSDNETTDARRTKMNDV
jgi:membrane protein